MFNYPQAMLIDWLPDMENLSEWVTREVKQNQRDMDDVQRLMVELAVQIRNQGIADGDFSARNVLFPNKYDTPQDFTWIDLEYSKFVSPDDSKGTLEMLASMLTNWWVICGADQDSLQRLFSYAVAEFPEPANGWNPLLTKLNPILEQRLLGRVARKQVDHPCNPLML